MSNLTNHLTSYERSKASHDAGFVRESVFVYIDEEILVKTIWYGVFEKQNMVYTTVRPTPAPK